ncbi:hypothetical protein WS67_22345 [Burkholderia singularis]|uniref:Uncharacterized protein n=1 Tax=Burkholderia singularis TaxID=1503053 RepID=A0A103DWZ3_9BURK|nr:hypothetical protein WS67_22345 [Burkholderia singularis]
MRPTRFATLAAAAMIVDRVFFGMAAFNFSAGRCGPHGGDERQSSRMHRDRQRRCLLAAAS